MCRRAGENGRDEPRYCVRPVGLRGRVRRRAVVHRGRLHNRAEARRQRRERVVVGAVRGQRRLHPPQPARGV